MKITAGIDGGGTKTTLVILDGKKQKRKSFGAFNLNSIGKERFQELLTELFDTLTQAGECEAVCIGAAGISNPQVHKIILDTAKRYELSKRILLQGDHDIALYGAMSGKPGAILIAGTGSICAGRAENGKTVRAGGWGHLIGDEGSGYAIGIDILKTVVKTYESTKKKTLLTELVYKHWKVSDIEGIIAKTYSTPDKSNIAALAPLAEEAARQGDRMAWQILQKNASELCKLAKQVCTQLGENPLSLCLMGGLLSHETLYRDLVKEVLISKNILFKDPDMDAAAGAALWARDWVLQNSDKN